MPFNLATARPVKSPGFDINTARVVGMEEPGPTEQAAAPAKLTPPPAPAGGIMTGQDPRAQYVVDYAKGLWDSITNPQVDPNANKGNAITGMLDAAATVGSGVAAPVLGAFDKYGGMLPGPNDQVPLRDHIADYQYQPRTQTGQALTGVVGAAAKPIMDALETAGGWVRQGLEHLGVDPTTADDAGVALSQVAPTVFGTPPAMSALRTGASEGLAAARAGTRGMMERAGRPMAPEGFVRNPKPAGNAAAQARRMGFILDPSDVQTAAQLEAPVGDVPRVPGKWTASYAGPEFRSAASAENAKIVSAGARRELGVDSATPLNETTYAMAKGSHNAVYNTLEQRVPTTVLDGQAIQDIADIGRRERENPLVESDVGVDRLYARLADSASGGQVATSDVLHAIRKYRARSRTLFQSPGGANPVATQEMAHAYRNAADALEGALMRTAESTGDASLVQAMQQSRAALARIHNLEDATIGGFIDPQLVLKLRDNGAPLTGFLAEVADAAQHFPNTVNLPLGARSPTPNMSQMLATTEFGKRRIGGEMLIRPLLREGFQSKFGSREPGFNPSDTRPDFPPPPPPAPGAPPDGRYPWSPAGEGPLSLVPDEGGLPFSESQLPALGGDGLALSDQVVPDLFRGADVSAADGLALPGVLDGPDLGPILPRWGAEPFSETQPLQPGAAIGAADHYGVGPSRPGEMQLGDLFVGPHAPQVETGPGRLWTDPDGAPNFPPEGAGRAPAVTGGRPVGPRDMGPADLRTVDETLPQRLSDLQQPIQLPGQIGSYGTLEPELQALADVLMGRESPGGAVVPYNALQGLADALGVNLDRPGPTPPMNPPRGSRGLRGQRDALEASRETPPAAPEEFPALGETASAAGPRALGDDLTLADEPSAAAKAPEFADTKVDLDALPRPTNLPKGEATVVKLYRGVAEGADPDAPGYGGAVMYAEDAKSAGVYGPNVAERDVSFNNLLRAGPLSSAVGMLGLPPSATLADIFARARQLGYDGIQYQVPYGPIEFAKL